MMRGIRPLVLSASLLASVVCAPLVMAGPDTTLDVRSEVLAPGVGYVSVVRLTDQPDVAMDGRLLAVFERPRKEGIPLYASKDNGAHWAFLSYVRDQEHPDDPSWQLRWQPNISEVHRRSGDLAPGTLLLAANATRSGEGSPSTAEDLQLYVSTDGGRSWHYRSSIVKGGGRPEDKDNRGVWEPFIRILDDGRMVAWYSSEQHKAQGYNQVIAHKVSRDGGKHWGPEHLDVAIPGGVQRPGMATVTRLPDGRYAMTYENIDGPHNGQVFIKFSRDGLDWGDPSDHGTPVVSAGGSWPAACPVVHWFPVGGPQGVIVVSSERAGGGGNEGGQSLYWNNALGRGAWWEVPAPVHKRTGNIHAGWTQALMRLDNGKFLHITSSSSATAPEKPGRNVILHATASLDWHRYEAGDAERRGAAVINDDQSSNGRKVRLGTTGEARLRFPVHVGAKGTYEVHLRFAEVGLPGHPLLGVNGTAPVAGVHVSEDGAGWKVATWKVDLLSGLNIIDVRSAGHVLDIDYLQVDEQVEKRD